LLHPLRWIRRIVTAVVLAALFYYAVCAVQVLTASRAPGAVAAAPRRPAVIVVSAGAQRRHGIGADLHLRLVHARALWIAHRVPRVVVCASSRAEANAAKAWLVAHGVATGDVALVFAAELPGQLHLVAVHLPYARHALVVADGWQTLWVTHVATWAGLTVVAAPVTPPHVSSFGKIDDVLVQAGAVAWGRIAGFGQTGFIAG
jgi:hypothetical protein